MNPKFQVNDKVIGRYEHKNMTGIIIDIKVMKLPFNMRDLILYLVKNSDNHCEWVNEFYLKKV